MNNETAPMASNVRPATPSPAAPAKPRAAGIAIASLVLGIISPMLCFLGMLASIPAVICGHLGLARIKASGGALGGNGFAVAGLVLGYLNIVGCVVLIPMYLAIMIPAVSQARNTAQRSACINNLRQIETAKEVCAIEQALQPGSAPTEPQLSPYLPNGLLPACPQNGTYTINPIGEEATCSIHGALSTAYGGTYDSYEDTTVPVEAD